MWFSGSMVGIFIYFRFYNCCGDDSRFTHFCDPSFFILLSDFFFLFFDKPFLFYMVRIFFFSFDGKIFCPHFFAFLGEITFFSHFCWRHFLYFLFFSSCWTFPTRWQIALQGSIFSTSPNDKHVLQKCLQTANVSFSTKIKTHYKNKVTRGGVVHLQLFFKEYSCSAVALNNCIKHFIRWFFHRVRSLEHIFPKLHWQVLSYLPHGGGKFAFSFPRNICFKHLLPSPPNPAVT